MHWDDENKASEAEETAGREKNKKSITKWVWGAIAGCMALLITYWVFWDTSAGTTQTAQNTPSVSRPAGMVQAPPSPCNHEEKEYRFDDTWQQIQPSTAPCSGDLYYPRKHVRLWVKTWSDPNTPQGPYTWGNKMPDDVVSIKSEGQVLLAKVVLVPKRFN